MTAVIPIANGVGTVPEGVRGDLTELACAVIQTAFENVAAYGRALRRQRRCRESIQKAAIDAVKWAIEDGVGLHGFQWWCLLACVNPEDIRCELLRQWESVRPVQSFGDGTRWQGANVA